MSYRGDKVVLRARTVEDRRTMYRWMQDPAVWRLVESEPWVGESPEAAEKRFAEATPRSDFVALAVDVDGEFVGHVVLYGIDLHNRKADVGIVLGPDRTGQGIGRDALRVLARYAFRERGLHRLGLQVLATNERAIRCYRAVGFVEEGRLRDHAWADGEWVDELQMSLLASDVEDLA